MTMELVAIKAVLITVVLYLLSVVFGGWVKFRSWTPLITTALFIVPINVMLGRLTLLFGLPLTPLNVFLVAVCVNAAVLYFLSLVIVNFQIENFPAAIAFALLLSAFSFYLNVSLAEKIAEWL